MTEESKVLSFRYRLKTFPPNIYILLRLYEITLDYHEGTLQKK